LLAAAARFAARGAFVLRRRGFAGSSLAVCAAALSVATLAGGGLIRFVVFGTLFVSAVGMRHPLRR
jgi:hypothetical protein